MKLHASLSAKAGGRLAARAALVLIAAISLSSCVLFKRMHNQDVGANVAPGDQPDKILFEKANNEIAKGRYDVGRLTLQVLINTYPDSEYLSRAKLLTAESYYKQGGISGLTQAEAEYIDFRTFFPTAPEAPRAEYLAGMCHFRLMGKADRDLTEAREAQVEFKTFLDQYPDNPLVPAVKARMREVQEVLAAGDYDTALHYYKRSAIRAATSRFQEIADDYPSFSEADQALWYLGQAQEKLRKSKDAATSYSRILTDYPLSPSTKVAKARLIAMHEPIPRPTKATLARARADRAVQEQTHKDLMAVLTGGFSSGPDLSQTRHGPVRLTHPKTSSQQAAGQSAPGGTVVAQPLSENPAAAPASTSPETAKPPDSTAPAAPGSPASTTAVPSAPVASPAAADTAAPKPLETAPDASATPPASTTPAAGANPTGDKSAATPDATATAKDDQSSSSSSSSTPPAKKKGKLHFLKKIIPHPGS